MKSSQPLLDSLTSHISLYSSSSTSPNPHPNPRSAILRHITTLPLPTLQSILTFTDLKFTQLLLQMHSHVTSQGPTIFFLLPDIPSDLSLPSLCTRRSHGLISRKIEKNGRILDSLLLFGAKFEDVIDTVMLSENIVKNVDEFVKVMDEVTSGRFLRGEEKGLGEEWKEMLWFKERGYFSMEEFVVNRIEVVVRRWWGRGKGKGGGGGESVFWRKKGCVDWWVGLEDRARGEFCVGFFGKAAKSLVMFIFLGCLMLFAVVLSLLLQCKFPKSCISIVFFITLRRKEANFAILSQNL